MKKYRIWSKNKIKVRAVKMHGAECAECGLKCHPSGYDFHHLDPNKKEFSIANAKTRSWEAVKKELKKCVMLCAICHRVHHISPGFWPELGEVDVDPKPLRKERLCKRCGTPMTKNGKKERDWRRVRYCSKECKNAARGTPSPEQVVVYVKKHSRKAAAEKFKRSLSTIDRIRRNYIGMSL